MKFYIGLIMQSVEYIDLPSIRPLFDDLKAFTGFTLSNEPSYSALDSVQVVLQNSQLWKKFHHFGNEMILTKVGR